MKYLRKWAVHRRISIERRKKHTNQKQWTATNSWKKKKNEIKWTPTATARDNHKEHDPSAITFPPTPTPAPLPLRPLSPPHTRPPQMGRRAHRPPLILTPPSWADKYTSWRALISAVFILFQNIHKLRRICGWPTRTLLPTKPNYGANFH